MVTFHLMWGKACNICLSFLFAFPGMVLSLHLKSPVLREREDLHSTWLSWTSWASSPPNLWDKTRGLCKCCFPAELWAFSFSEQQMCVMTDSAGVWTWKSFWNTKMWFDFISVTSLLSSATCTWSASWRSRWHCSEKIAGFPWSPTETPCRLAATMTPCLWWAATQAEAPPFAPRRLNLLWLQPERLQQSGNYQRVWRPNLFLVTMPRIRCFTKWLWTLMAHFIWDMSVRIIVPW